MKTVDPRLWALYEKAVGWVQRYVKDEDDARNLVLKMIESIDVSCLRDDGVAPFLRTSLRNSALNFIALRSLQIENAPVPDRTDTETPEQIVSARQQARLVDVQIPGAFTILLTSDKSLTSKERMRLARVRAAIRKLGI
jgi:hypothetical protein